MLRYKTLSSVLKTERKYFLYLKVRVSRVPFLQYGSREEKSGVLLRFYMTGTISWHCLLLQVSVQTRAHLRYFHRSQNFLSAEESTFNLKFRETQETMQTYSLF